MEVRKDATMSEILADIEDLLTGIYADGRSMTYQEYSDIKQLVQHLDNAAKELAGAAEMLEVIGVRMKWLR